MLAHQIDVTPLTLVLLGQRRDAPVFETLLQRRIVSAQEVENERDRIMPGNQRRNFTHVDDTVDALMLIGQYGKGDEYGIGVETSYTVLEVAKMFGE